MSVCLEDELVLCSLCLLLTPDVFVDMIINHVSNMARLYVQSDVWCQCAPAAQQQFVT